MRRTSLCTALAAISVVVCAAGCETDVESRIALAQLGDSCHLNSDCDALMICAFERCHVACNDSRDCEDGARCVRGARQRNVCQLEDEQACSQEDPCPGSQLCGTDETCRDACRAKGDCIGGQVCSGGACADGTEVDSNGLLPTANATNPCTYDSDCPASFVCEGGECRAECLSSRDCAVGQVCTAGVCEQVPTSAGCVLASDCNEDQSCVEGECVDVTLGPLPECKYSSDCLITGQHCILGKCDCECSEDSDCGAEQDCWNDCACRSTRKIVGDVRVTNGVELGQLDDVDEIEGKLTLYLQSVGAFRVPSLRKATSILVDGHEVSPSVVFDALEEVTETFQCDQACFAPRLEKAGAVTLHSLNMHEFALPALTTITVELRAFDNPRLAIIDLPKLASVQNVDVSGNQLLETVDLPALKTVESNLKLSENPRLATLNLSALSSAASIQLAELPQLTSSSLDGMKAAEPPAPAPYIGNMVIDDTGLTSIEPFNLLTALANDAPLTVTFNRALPCSALEALHDQLKARTPAWAGTYDNGSCE